jgi:hypothetical protein
VKLHLGCVDVQYTNSKEGETTFEVAQILEKKYHVMDIFYEMHTADIAKELESRIAGAIERAFAGHKSPNLFTAMDPFFGIEEKFREYIDREEHGIKLKRISKPVAGGRKKRQYKKVETPLPAFVYSGLYRYNFRAWIEK